MIDAKTGLEIRKAEQSANGLWFAFASHPKNYSEKYVLSFESDYVEGPFADLEAGFRRFKEVVRLNVA